MGTHSSDLILRSKRVVTGSGVQAAGILIKTGKIAEVGAQIGRSVDVPVEDVGNDVIMPGLVDAHVHINEPGRTEWEGFEAATRAAAAGGVTTLADMPLNSTPVTTTAAAFEQKLAAARGKLWVDCGFYAGLVPENSGTLAPLLEAGVLGVKVFLIHSGIDDFPNATAADLRAAMPEIAKRNLPLLVHAELENADAATQAEPRRYQSYLASRPASWENDAVGLMIDLCREYRCRTHIVHLSSAEAIPFLKSAQEQGLSLTVETCPHYLFFAAEEIASGDTRFKCAPPIRERDNREQLWQALRENVIDFIASDHSPCPPEMKLLEAGDFQGAWGGISSLQFTLPVMWTAARQRGFSIFDLSEWLSRRPAEFLGLRRQKGAIAPGCDADLVVWNPEASFTLAPDQVLHRHKITPYAGQQLAGIVKMVYLRGNKIYEHGRFDGEARGEILLRG